MIKKLRRFKVPVLGISFSCLTLFAFWFSKEAQAGNYGCPYKYCDGCWCVDGVCRVATGCPDECSGSFGYGEEYCCPPATEPPIEPSIEPPGPTPVPQGCNEICLWSVQCSTGYCYRPVIWWWGVCRNSSCPLDQDCICPATPTPTPKKACDQSCLNDGECSTSYCYQGRCRNQDCPDETDCTCPLRECNQSCESNDECETVYCYRKRWCRNKKCPDEEDCECPETKMCYFKGCESVNGRCIQKEFGPIPWEAPCPEDDCQNDNDCRNIKLCSWNQCACPDDFCYGFEDIAFDPDESCPVSDCDEPGTYDEDCYFCPPEGCGNNVREGVEDCDGADDDLCPGECRPNCTCPSGAVCGNDVVEGSEECDGTDNDACPGECQADCTCPLPPGWFQTEGGDVHSNYASDIGESVFSEIPDTADNPFFSLETNETDVFNPFLSLSTPGIVSGSNTDMSFGSGSVSTKDWRIDSYSGQLYTGTPLPRYDYHYFHDILGLGDGALACPGGPSSGIFRCGPGLDVDGWDLGAGDRMIVFVEGGDLNINAEINVPLGAFLAFIVQGNINVDPSIGGEIDETDGIDEDEVFIDGVYIADGQILTGESNERLVASGIFVSYGGFGLQRDLEDDNETTPAELFLYRPDFIVNALEELEKSGIIWKEVAP